MFGRNAYCMPSLSASTDSASCCSSIIQPRATSCRQMTSGDSRAIVSTRASSDGICPASKPWWMLYVMRRNVTRAGSGAASAGVAMYHATGPPIAMAAVTIASSGPRRTAGAGATATPTATSAVAAQTAGRYAQNA